MIAVRKFKSFVNHLIIMILILTSILYSQEECNILSFNINEKLFNSDIVAYYLSAIDVNSGASHIPLFEYSIETEDQNCYNLDYPSNINLILEFYYQF